MSEPSNRADEGQAILEIRDQHGAPLYDHVHQDESGQWWARRHSDHTAVERVDPAGRAGG